MTWPTESAGRWLEPCGNARPRGMTVIASRGSPTCWGNPQQAVTESRLSACFTLTRFPAFVAQWRRTGFFSRECDALHIAAARESSTMGP